MDGYLKQSTTVTVQVGPFLDDTDGKTAETGLTPTVEISKAGAAFAARGASTVAHDADGWYRVELNTTDTGTLGILKVKSTETGALPVWHTFLIVTANVFDSLYASGDTLDVQVTGIGADAITAAAVAADVTTELQSGLATAAALATVDDFLDTEIAAIKAKTDLLPAAPAATGDIPTAATVADAVWDEDRASHTSAGSFGEGVNVSDDGVGAIWDETSSELGGAPSATPTMRAAIQFLLQALRNRITTSASETKIHNDAGAAIATASVSDDGETFTRGEYA